MHRKAKFSLSHLLTKFEDRLLDAHRSSQFFQCSSLATLKLIDLLIQFSERRGRCHLHHLVSILLPQPCWPISKILPVRKRLRFPLTNSEKFQVKTTLNFTVGKIPAPLYKRSFGTVVEKIYFMNANTHKNFSETSPTPQWHSQEGWTTFATSSNSSFPNFSTPSNTLTLFGEDHPSLRHKAATPLQPPQKFVDLRCHTEATALRAL